MSPPRVVAAAQQLADASEHLKKTRSTIVQLKQALFWGAPGTGQSGCLSLSQDFREQPLLALEVLFIEEMKCSQGQESLLSYIVRKAEQWRGKNEAIYTTGMGSKV